MPNRTPLPPIAIAVVAAACGQGLPLEERIASTRPLGMRVEILDPAAAPDDPVAAEGLPLDTARIVPFIVDENAPLSEDTIGTAIEPVWLSCSLQPFEGLFACLGNRLPLSLAEIVDCPPVDVTMIDPSDFQPPPSPCRITGGTPGAPELTIPIDPSFILGGDLELTMIGHVPGEGSTAECAEALLGQADRLPRSCMFATQRVSVGPDGDLFALAAMLGVDLDEAGLPPPPDPVPEPDANPRIMSFAVRVFDDRDNELSVQTIARGDEITVPEGARLDIETIAPKEDLQTYAIPVDMSAYEDRDETYSGRWFRTWGTLLSSTSNDPLSFNTWTMVAGEQDEDELPANNRATLYYVLRDDRQGTDWWWFQVVVTPA